MFARLILSVSLAASAISGFGNRAAGAENEASKVSVSSENTVTEKGEWSTRLKPGPQEANKSMFLAQMIPAQMCYTFAGPVCRLVVALPQGASCTCYFPYQPPLAGVAY